jgi:hypothetical protein
MRLIPKY